jgi:protein-disulfide isomerase
MSVVMSPIRRPRLSLSVGFALAVAVGLAGCGDTASVLTTASSDTAGASVDKAGFEPFSDRLETQIGAREVLANPTLADVLKSVSSLPEMSWGRPDAPVVLIKYASLTCPYCRKFHAETFPQLKRDYIDTGKVRFVMREFPIGKASGTATVALRCAPADKYLDLYGRYLAQQGAWVSQEVRSEAIFKVAAQAGVTDAQFSSCMADKTLAKELNTIKERGRTLGIIGTPNFFIDNKLIKSVVTYADLKVMLDQRLAGKTQ